MDRSYYVMSLQADLPARLWATSTQSSIVRRGRPSGRPTTAAPVRDDLEQHRQHRYEDNPDRHEREVVLDDRHVAEQPAGAEAQRDPRHRADDVVQHEGGGGHLRRARDERDERADDRDEAA